MTILTGVTESSSNTVMCECSDSSERYDVESHACISSCNDGEVWESVTSSEFDSIHSDTGRCVGCPPGKISSSRGDWATTTCENCSPGKFSSGNASNMCLSCPSTMHAPTEGSTTCLSCPPGKKANQDLGSTSCENLPAGQFGLGMNSPTMTRKLWYPTSTYKR